ncbi:AAA family ATPase [Patescibacteria group bacterium]|nr:AAA family ATPase [Patescibacteria group bacterium]MBU1721210.1 AAA family ATPase [Patescibacteria group bacterium]MBU1901082.1 AAA family ATPase [Patescibacteria group bacterium]
MITNKKIILGFTGMIACGKGTAAAYMEEKYGASTYRFSTMLRDVMDRFHLPHTRENLVGISEYIRNTHGEDTMAKTMAKDVEQDKTQIIIVEGIRRMADIAYLTQLPNFVLVNIEATPEHRYERIIKRGENSDDNSKTYEAFLADHERPTEITIPEVMTHAKETIHNDGSLKELYAQLDTLIQTHGHQN